MKYLFKFIFDILKVECIYGKGFKEEVFFLGLLLRLLGGYVFC